MIGVFSALDVAASGLSAERTRMSTIASNMANARTTRTPAGGPYKRLSPVFEARPVGGPGDPAALGRAVSKVAVQRVVEDRRDPTLVYEPGHPDADGRGYVRYPNVNVVAEMVDMMSASQAYEAGVASIESVKAMARSALVIGR